MASFNRVILLGNLTRDPQMSYLPSGTAVCEFGLAVNHRYRDRDGNPKEDVCFVDMTAYGKQAEVINQYMSKGRSMLVEGRLRYRQWTGKDGQNRSKLEVVIENFTFVGPGGAGGRSGAERPSGRGAAPAAVQPDEPSAPVEDDLPPPDPDVPF